MWNAGMCLKTTPSRPRPRVFKAKALEGQTKLQRVALN